MLSAVLIVGFLILVWTPFGLWKFGKIKPMINIFLLVGLTFQFLYIAGGGEIKFLKKWTKGSRFQAEATNDQIGDDHIYYIKIKEKVLLDAPIIKQYPELPRGCEVTSLAMLLQYQGIKTNKMELASKIKKDSTPFRNENGIIYWGSPNNGFIGDMYSYSNPGYGVYHEPIRELAEEFLPGQIVDLTGRNFAELKTYLSLDIPIWVITNTTYKKLPNTAFQTWKTPNGEVRITFKEHSVLITGYDEESIYFNDPITGMKNKVAPLKDFLEAWKQMGSQAITYLPEQSKK